MKKQLGPSDTTFPVAAALIVSGINEDAKRFRNLRTISPGQPDISRFEDQISKPIKLCYTH